MSKKDNDKIIDFSEYLAEKDFEELLQSELAGFSDEELDELYDDLAFGLEADEELQEAELESARENFRLLKDLEEIEIAGHDALLASSPVSWVNLDKRSYLSNKMALATTYKQNGLYQKALDHFLEIYQVEETDGLRTRYEIMSSYVLMSKHEELKAFYFSKDYHQGDLMMDIPYIISSILAGQEESVRDILYDWLFKVDGFFAFCNQPMMPLEAIMEVSSLDSYQANSMTAVYVSLSTFLPILIPSNHYIMAIIQQLLDIEESPLIENLEVFSSVQLNTLTSFGIQYVSDIEEWSEAEFREIPKIGPTTIKKLKEKGVVFQS
ncbi:hypothetical protein [Streptococcus hyovaginalis]|uniref:hypothetical protein n=1 Tax=Streptococcus hyovaginalis TaxID=149015 RepID=UPI0014789F75|nr:hypothetical protein [Streptococcus hyovaginalis]